MTVLSQEDMTKSLIEMFPQQGEGDDNLLRAFLTSTVSSPMELFGFDPLEGVKKFRQSNPIMGLGSELIGTGGIYGAAWGASKKIRAIDKFITGISGKVDSKLLSRAAEEMMRAAPLEVAAGVSRVSQNQDIADSLAHAGLNLGIAGGIGGVIGLLQSVGTRVGAKTAYDMAKPGDTLNGAIHAMKVALQQADDKIAAGGPAAKEAGDQATKLRAQLKEARHDVRTELPQGTKTIEDSDGTIRTQQGPAVQAEVVTGTNGRLTKSDTKKVGLAFKVASRKEYTSKQLIMNDKTGFKLGEEGELAEIFSKFGLKTDWEDFVQFPRFRRYKEGQGDAARNFNKFVEDNFFKANDANGIRTFYTLEPETNMFTVAQLLKGKTRKDDQWLFFKTEFIDKFAKTQADHKDFMAATSMFQGQRPVKPMKFVPDRKLGQSDEQVGVAAEMLNKDSLWNSGIEFMKMLPLVETAGIHAKDISTRIGKKAMSAIGVDPADNILINRVSDAINKYWTPAQQQGRDNALFRYLRTTAVFVHDKAGSKAQAWLLGRTSLEKGIWHGIKHGTTRVGVMPGVNPLVPAIKALETDTRSRAQIMWVWSNHLDVKTAEKRLLDGRDFEVAGGLGPLTPQAKKILEDLALKDSLAMHELMALAKEGVVEVGEAGRNHYGISRSWRGKHRILVRDEQNNVIMVATGIDGKAAQAMADDIVAQAKKDNRQWKVTDSDFVTSGHADLELAKKISLDGKDFIDAQKYQAAHFMKNRKPAFMKSRKGVKGFIGEDSDLVWTSQELIDIVSKHTQSVERYIAGKTVDHLVGNSGLATTLKAQDPALAGILNDRLADLRLDQGAFGAIQNQFVDKILSPILGKNSATQIAQAVNGGMFHWMLGAGNIGFTAINAMTFMITSMPQAAYVLNTSAGRLNNFYTTLPMIHKSGQVQGIASVLDPARIAMQAFRQMKDITKNPELRLYMEHLSDTGTTNPRFAESVMGQSSTDVLNMKEAFSSVGGFGRWLKAVSEYGPSVSERMTRQHAASMAYTIGKDFKGLSGDALLQFGKEYTDNSMFLYSTADRARMMSGPLGSMAGLFKNWQLHQMFWTAEMFGEMFQKTANGRLNLEPALWAVGGTLATGGVGAMPLMFAAEGMSQFMSDKSVMQNIYDAWGDPSGETVMADTMWMGLPALLGISMQTQSESVMNPRSIAMMAQSVYWDYGAALHRAGSSAYDHLSYTGQHPGDSSEVRRNLLKVLAPKTMNKFWDVAQDGAINSLRTGNQMISGLGWGERIAYSTGMSSTRIAKMYKRNEELWTDQKELRGRLTAYGTAIAEATKAKQWEEVTDLYNRARLDGMDLGSVGRSVSARLDRMTTDQTQRQFSLSERLPYKNLGIGL